MPTKQEIEEETAALHEKHLRAGSWVKYVSTAPEGRSPVSRTGKVTTIEHGNAEGASKKLVRWREFFSFSFSRFLVP
jgi:hypothetical protein